MRMTNLNTIETIKKVVTASGTPEILSPSYTATTIAFNDNSGTPPTAATYDTITDSDSQFLVNGFKIGDIILITGSASNNVEAEIKTVTAGTITITLMGYLTTEIAGETVTILSKRGIKIPDGIKAVVKANDDNDGSITLADTSAKAINTNTSYFSNYVLDNGQAVELYIKNLNQIWMDATSSGDGVNIIFEK